MRTKKLQKALTFHRDTKAIFRGVFPSNRLPVIPRGKVVTLVANTDPSHKPGQHWVAYFFTKTHVYYFDSYGLPPMTPSLARLMKRRKHRKYFCRRLQGRGYVCGEYCLYFILAMIYDMDFSCFGDDLNANDRYVRKFIRKHFPLIG